MAGALGPATGARGAPIRAIDRMSANVYLLPCADGWMAASARSPAQCGQPGARGKSGLHEATVPGNARAGKPDGKRHRKQTAPVSAGVRVKRWGKSPPRDWQQDRHGKPHREQRRIGIVCCAACGDGRGASPRAIRVGGWTLRAIAGREEWSSTGARALGTKSGLQAVRANSASTIARKRGHGTSSHPHGFPPLRHSERALKHRPRHDRDLRFGPN